MSEDEHALLAAIAAAPDDDTPRLVYADWLEEHGHPDRGRLIRRSCELARLVIGDPAIRNRALALIKSGDSEVSAYRSWLDELNCLFPDPSACFLPYRGMPAALHCTPEYFRKYAARIATTTPLARIRLRDLSPMSIAGLVNVPEFFRIPDYGFSAFDFDPACARVLLRLPINHIRRVTITRTGNWTSLGPAVVWPEVLAESIRLLTRSATLAGVRQLDFRNAGIGDSGGIALARSDCFPALELLLVCGNQLSDSAREALRRRFGTRVFFDPDEYQGRLTYGEVN